MGWGGNGVPTPSRRPPPPVRSGDSPRRPPRAALAGGPGGTAPGGEGGGLRPPFERNHDGGDAREGGLGGPSLGGGRLKGWMPLALRPPRTPSSRRRRASGRTLGPWWRPSSGLGGRPPGPRVSGAGACARPASPRAEVPRPGALRGRLGGGPRPVSFPFPGSRPGEAPPRPLPVARVAAPGPRRPGPGDADGRGTRRHE